MMRFLSGRKRCRRGSVLLVVLWLLIMVGVLSIGYAATVRSRVLVAQATRGRTEAWWAARAGIEKARALLLTADLETVALDHPLFDDREAFERQEVGPAWFSLIVESADADEALRFGMMDEASKLNINQASEEMLANFEGMSATMAHGLLDWRDSDFAVRAMGAEDEYYESLEHPYPARNEGLRSVRELVRVHGWEEIWTAAEPDPYARFLSDEPRSNAFDPDEARRILSSLTVWSSDPRKAPDGETRMNLNAVKQDEMEARVEDLAEEEAKAIEGHQSNFSAATDLLDVNKPQENAQNTRNEQEEQGEVNGERGAGGGPGGRRNNQGQAQGRGNRSGGRNGGQGRQAARGEGEGSQANTAQSTEEKAFSRERVGEIVDYFGVGEQLDTPIPGRVNINTAPHNILMTLPGMTEELADEITALRQTTPFTRAGEIATIAGMTDEIFRELYPFVTTTSRQFRVVSEGIEPSSEARVRIEAVLAVEEDRIDILYWREGGRRMSPRLRYLLHVRPQGLRWLAVEDSREARVIDWGEMEGVPKELLDRWIEKTSPAEEAIDLYDSRPFYFNIETRLPEQALKKRAEIVRLKIRQEVGLTEEEVCWSSFLEKEPDRHNGARMLHTVVARRNALDDVRAWQARHGLRHLRVGSDLTAIRRLVQEGLLSEGVCLEDVDQDGATLYRIEPGNGVDRRRENRPDMEAPSLRFGRGAQMTDDDLRTAWRRRLPIDETERSLLSFDPVLLGGLLSVIESGEVWESLLDAEGATPSWARVAESMSGRRIAILTAVAVALFAASGWAMLKYRETMRIELAREAEAVAEETRLLRSQEAVLRQIMAERRPLTPVFETLHRLTPDGITLETLGIGENGLLKLQGTAKGTEGANALQQAIGGSDVFESMPELLEVRQGPERNQVSFQLTARIRGRGGRR